MDSSIEREREISRNIELRVIEIKREDIHTFHCVCVRERDSQLDR